MSLAFQELALAAVAATPGGPPTRPVPGSNGSADAQTQATRLCPPFLERGRPAPSADRTATGTARDLTRSYQAQTARTGGQSSRSPRPGTGGSSGYIRGRPARSTGESGHPGSRTSASAAPATVGGTGGDRLWRCPSARRVSAATPNTGGGRRAVPPISGLLQLRQSSPSSRPTANHSTNNSAPSAAASIASAAEAAVAAAMAVRALDTPSQAPGDGTEHPAPSTDRPSLSSIIRTAGSSRGPRGATRLDGRAGGTSSSTSISGAAAPEVYKGGGSISVKVAGGSLSVKAAAGSISVSVGGSGTYSLGGCGGTPRGGSISMVAAAAAPPLAAPSRRKSPSSSLAPTAVVMPSSVVPACVATSTLLSSPHPQAPLSIVVASIAGPGMTPLSTPRANNDGLPSPRMQIVAVEDSDPDLLHQTVLQFSQQRPAGRQPLLRLSAGIYLHGNKKLSLMLKNGRLMVCIGGGFVGLSETLLASPALGGVGSGVPQTATMVALPEAQGFASTYTMMAGSGGPIGVATMAMPGAGRHGGATMTMSPRGEQQPVMAGQYPSGVVPMRLFQSSHGVYR